MIKPDEAGEAARLVFREHLTRQPRVPDDIAKRLAVGYLRDGRDWIVQVTLMSADPEAGALGLAADLDGPLPPLVAAIRVDGVTGHATLEEWALPIWQAGFEGDEQASG